jgi:hypothetical protein
MRGSKEGKSSGPIQDFSWSCSWNGKHEAEEFDGGEQVRIIVSDWFNRADELYRLAVEDGPAGETGIMCARVGNSAKSLVIAPSRDKLRDPVIRPNNLAKIERAGIPGGQQFSSQPNPQDRVRLRRAEIQPPLSVIKTKCRDALGEVSRGHVTCGRWEIEFSRRELRFNQRQITERRAERRKRFHERGSPL